jgi:hypothetical protein
MLPVTSKSLSLTVSSWESPSQGKFLTGLTNLETLDIASSPLSHMLYDLQGLTKLRHLDLFTTNATDEILGFVANHFSLLTVRTFVCLQSVHLAPICLQIGLFVTSGMYPCSFSMHRFK